MKRSEERSRKWVDFPNFTSLLLNPLRKANESIGELPILLSVQKAGLDMLTPTMRLCYILWLKSFMHIKSSILIRPNGTCLII
jgi:hypothetical protein